LRLQKRKKRRKRRKEGMKYNYYCILLSIIWLISERIGIYGFISSCNVKTGKKLLCNMVESDTTSNRRISKAKKYICNVS